MRSFSNRPDRVQVFFDDDDGVTRQSMAAECDINNIMAKFQKTGALTHFSRHQARYGFADSVTFHDAMNIVAEGDSMFADLPSSLRTRFENDPGRFLDFVQDPKNAEELVSLGLAEARALDSAPPEPTAEQPPAGEIVAPATSEAAVAAAEASD